MPSAEPLVLSTALDGFILRELTTLYDDRSLYNLVHQAANREHCRELVYDYPDLATVTKERTDARENGELLFGMVDLRLGATLGGLIVTRGEAGEPFGNWIAWAISKQYTRQGRTFAAARAAIRYVERTPGFKTTTLLPLPLRTINPVLHF